jgi:hypothetical protein
MSLKDIDLLTTTRLELRLAELLHSFRNQLAWVGHQTITLALEVLYRLLH